MAKGHKASTIIAIGSGGKLGPEFDCVGSRTDGGGGDQSIGRQLLLALAERVAAGACGAIKADHLSDSGALANSLPVDAIAHSQAATQLAHVEGGAINAADETGVGKPQFLVAERCRIGQGFKTCTGKVLALVNAVSAGAGGGIKGTENPNDLGIWLQTGACEQISLIQAPVAAEGCHREGGASDACGELGKRTTWQLISRRVVQNRVI